MIYELDLGHEWELEEIEIFLKRKLIRLQGKRSAKTRSDAKQDEGCRIQQDD